jgi:hypothetical protein
MWFAATWFATTWFAITFTLGSAPVSTVGDSATNVSATVVSPVSTADNALRSIWFKRSKFAKFFHGKAAERGLYWPRRF